MIVPLGFEGPEQFVWDTDLAKLPARVQAAWAAYCVGSTGQLLPPSFHARFPFTLCIRTAWDFALLRPQDRSALVRLNEEMIEYGEVLGQTERPPRHDNPGWWMCVEGYQLAHVVAPGQLFELVLTPDWLSSNAMDAVEAAGKVYKKYQFWRQGFDDVADEAFSYVDATKNVFYAMTRRAYDVALAHKGEPTETMFAGVEFPHDCPPLAPELAALSRKNPTPAIHEQWLRETGRWLGPT
jgi:hypothetical protein